MYTSSMNIKYLIICFFIFAFTVSIVSCIKDDENDPRAISTSSNPNAISYNLSQLSTLSISNITQISAICGGNITDDGGASVTSRGVCWSTSPNPTINSTHTTDGAGTGIFSSNIIGLTVATKYYVRAYAVNNAGIAYGLEQSFTTDQSLIPGLAYQGGIIFYVDSTGMHGLICAEEDQSTSAIWGCPNTQIPGADATALGSGQPNSYDILIGCTSPGIAAFICDTLIENGYADWFLPSKGELLLMYQNLKPAGYGNFSNAAYWSSSEMTNVFGWQVIFGTGSTQGAGKNGAFSVRAIRIF